MPTRYSAEVKTPKKYFTGNLGKQKNFGKMLDATFNEQKTLLKGLTKPILMFPGNYFCYQNQYLFPMFTWTTTSESPKHEGPKTTSGKTAHTKYRKNINSNFCHHYIWDSWDTRVLLFLCLQICIEIMILLQKRNNRFLPHFSENWLFYYSQMANSIIISTKILLYIFRTSHTSTFLNWRPLHFQGLVMTFCKAINIFIGIHR